MAWHQTPKRRGHHRNHWWRGVGEDEVITAQPKTGEVRVNIPREEETPRRMYITKATVEKYGKTPGCPGCVAMETGKYGVHK